MKKKIKISFQIEILDKFNVPQTSCPTIKEYDKWRNKYKIRQHLGGTMVYLTG